MSRRGNGRGKGEEKGREGRREGGEREGKRRDGHPPHHEILDPSLFRVYLTQWRRSAVKSEGSG